MSVVFRPDAPSHPAASNHTLPHISLVSVLPELEALAEKVQELRERARQRRQDLRERARQRRQDLRERHTPRRVSIVGRVWWLKSEGPDGGVGALL